MQELTEGISMEQRMVKCVKLGRELPGLTMAPFNNDLGTRIYENVSQEAWNLFLRHLTMVINEYRLNLSAPESDAIVFKAAEDFLFGSAASAPPGYVAPK
jgi:Fe-S cluster biosynthesis and repair protein YggX